METRDITVGGLGDDVEIVVDTWGVPHIYARDRADLFFAQGFNAARDRLFQIDLWRRRGLGLLSEVFGPAFVEQDRAARLFLYRGDLRAEWLAYGSAAESIVSAFVRGVNAHIGWALAEPGRLPPEFVLHGYEPARWEPADPLRIRSHGLFYNADQELARARTLRDHGRVAERLRKTREPADELIMPDGLDLGVLGDDVLRVYELGRAAVVLPGEQGGAVNETSGSNNWVISGARTDTGRPILANDPHRAVSIPSLRYIAHLSAPGIDVIGGGEPALPGISIGHNGKVAFGLTIWPADQEDLYVYETRPGDPLSYSYGGAWEPMTVRREQVRDSAGVVHEVELRFTRHGPVIHEDPGRNVAVGLRAAWLEPGMAPYLASLEYLRAENAGQFVDALGRWGAPPVNQVYADTAGTIGWKNAGLVPVRPNWDGGLPVPGDGRYEWAGFYDTDQLPGLRDPEAGWFATANQLNLPDGWSNAERTITYDWYPPYRYERIAAELSAGNRRGVADSVALQNDVLSVAAVEIAGILRAVPAEHVAEADALRSVQTWPGEETAGSRAALVFQVWVRRHLRPALLARELRRAGIGEEGVAAALPRLLGDESVTPDLRAVLSVLRSFDLADPADVAALTVMVDRTLTAALREIGDRLGPDRSTWEWGRLHRARLRHPLLGHRSDVPDAWRGVGPAPKPGSGDTVGVAAYDGDFTMTLGSTFRMVVDVGDWDRSVAMNTPGQSGDPRSPHYADLFEPWLAGRAFPLNYTRTAVERNAELRITLRPPRTTES